MRGEYDNVLNHPVYHSNNSRLADYCYHSKNSFTGAVCP